MADLIKAITDLIEAVGSDKAAFIAVIFLSCYLAWRLIKRSDSDYSRLLDRIDTDYKELKESHEQCVRDHEQCRRDRDLHSMKIMALETKVDNLLR